MVFSVVDAERVLADDRVPAADQRDRGRPRDDHPGVAPGGPAASRRYQRGQVDSVALAQMVAMTHLLLGQFPHNVNVFCPQT